MPWNGRSLSPRNAWRGKGTPFFGPLSPSATLVVSLASRVGHHDFHYVIHARNSRWPPRSRPIAAILTAAITNGGRACALAGVSATRSFLLSPTDASSALNAELTPSFENSSIARFSFTIFSRNDVRGTSMRDSSFFPWMLYEFRKFSVLPRFALFQLFSRM